MTSRVNLAYFFNSEFVTQRFRPVSSFLHDNVPEQERPSPANPSLQVQLCPPKVLVQFAFTSQLWLPVLHSSISKKAIIL